MRTSSEVAARPQGGEREKGECGGGRGAVRTRPECDSSHQGRKGQAAFQRPPRRQTLRMMFFRQRTSRIRYQNATNVMAKASEALMGLSQER